MPEIAIRNVALLGGQGRLGAWILAALQRSGRFRITLLRRHGSRSVYDEADYPDLITETLPENYTQDHEGCVRSLQGQDALVIAIPGGKVEEQKALAAACIDAGVRRMIPADYGSLDSDDQVVTDLVPIFGHKKQVRQYIDSLAQASLKTSPAPPKSFSWTSIVCGHFIDYVLESPRMLHYDLQQRHASVLGSGDERWSACTRTRVGETVVRILSPEFEPSTRNRTIFVHSFSISQNRILDALKVVSNSGLQDDYMKERSVTLEQNETAEKGDTQCGGKASWTVERGDLQQWIQEKHSETKKATNEKDFWHATEELVGALGMQRANWEGREGFMNADFGFMDEDLEEVVEKSWKKGNGFQS